jgi:hypothetical protein
MTKLNQILSIEKSIKNKNETEFTRVYQAVKKVELTTGMTRNYVPKDENGEKFPPEKKLVQVRAEDAMQSVKKAVAAILNVTSQKDATNQVAKADIVVDGVTLLKDVPATHLLALEKTLVGIAAFVKDLPVLSADQEWSFDEPLGLFKTPTSETIRPKKVEGFVIMVPATDKFPAQTKNTVEDITVGIWRAVHYSGAITRDRQAAVLAKVEALQSAVKFARQAANNTEVIPLLSGDPCMNYIFG